MTELSFCLMQLLPEKVEGKQQPFTKLEAVSNGTAILAKKGLANDCKMICARYIGFTKPYWLYCAVRYKGNWPGM